MTSAVLTDNEVTSFIKEANMYLELSPNYKSWAPIKSIPDGYTHKWYTLEKVPVAAGSKDGRDYKDVQTARAESSASIISYRYGFSIPRVAVDMARQAGVPIWAENVAVSLKHMENTIAHLALEGSYTWDPVAINGLRDGGTDVGAIPDALMWDTITKPLGHIAEASKQLTNNGVSPTNLVWIMSSNLYPGLMAKYGAGDPSHMELAKAYGVSQFVFLPIGASTELTTYPIATATADDGVWFVYPNSQEYWYIAEVMPPTVTLNPTLNVKDNCYEGYIEWRGTVAVVHATAVIYFPECDLA